MFRRRMQTRLYLLLALLLVFTTVNTGAHSKGIGLDCSVWNDHSLNELKSFLDKSFREFMSIKVPESEILRTIKKDKERYLARGGTERMWQPPSRGVLRNRLRTKKYMKQYSRPLTDKEAYHFQLICFLTKSHLLYQKSSDLQRYKESLV